MASPKPQLAEAGKMRVESDRLYRRDEFAFSCQCFACPNYDFTGSGGAHSRMRWSSRCHNLMSNDVPQADDEQQLQDEEL
jgi:hypothetical protein